MLPTVISQDVVRCFSYWQEGIQTGMFHNGEIYTLVGRFSMQDRLSAYQTSFDLADQGNVLCITVDNANYYLWKALRSRAPSQPSSPTQGNPVIGQPTGFAEMS